MVVRGGGRGRCGREVVVVVRGGGRERCGREVVVVRGGGGGRCGVQPITCPPTLTSWQVALLRRGKRSAAPFATKGAAQDSVSTVSAVSQYVL